MLTPTNLRKIYILNVVSRKDFNRIEVLYQLRVSMASRNDLRRYTHHSVKSKTEVILRDV
jgi:hypothetical protein